MIATRPRRSHIAESVFSTEVRDPFGKLKYRSRRHNLRTTAGIDWQAVLMGGGGPGFTATAASVTATTLTATSPGWSANQWIGRSVVVGSVYGIILSNTTTVLTVDRWNNVATPGGAAGTTPSGTPVFVITSGGEPNNWMALTAAGAPTPITPSTSDTALSGELTTNGLQRVLATYAHTGGTASYTLSNTFTCSGGTGTTITGEAVFNAQNGGQMSFESAEPSPPTLNSGDTLAETVTVSY